MKTNFDFVKNQATGNVVLLRDRLRTTWIKIVSAEIDPKSQVKIRHHILILDLLNKYFTFRNNTS